jgi:hypothetical protein
VVAVPDLTAIKNYLGASAAQWSDEDLSDELASEIAAQALVCTIPDIYPSDLAKALKRRVQRALTLRAIPLGLVQGDAEGGSTVLPGRDPEIRRLEAGHRRLTVG